MSQPIHVAAVRRVKPGNEAEFERVLREFIRDSFAQSGVLGAGMIMPVPGSTPREYGILRTFASESERDAFYASDLFKAWSERCEPLTEGEATYRQLHGLEAWFRNPALPEPPVWKMAVLTFIAVWPISMAIPALLQPLIGNRVSNAIFAGAVAAGIVLVLTWGAMPLLAWLARRWLQPKLS
jgi:hypothetical protein